MLFTFYFPRLEHDMQALNVLSAAFPALVCICWQATAVSFSCSRAIRSLNEKRDERNYSYLCFYFVTSAACFTSITMANLSIFVPVLLLALFIKEGEPVRCWTCSSDLNPQCRDPFLAGRPENNYMFRLENCDANTGATYPYLTSSKSACKKQTKYINGQQIISRGCTWKRQDDFSTSCPSSSNGPNEVTSFCETCEYDGCNGATTIGKTIALLAAPLTLLLFK